MTKPGSVYIVFILEAIDETEVLITALQAVDTAGIPALA